jgi:hypothetical protein
LYEQRADFANTVRGTRCAKKSDAADSVVGAPPTAARTASHLRETIFHRSDEIADSRPGIALDDVERLKRPCTRAWAARANAAGVAGAGLGLAILARKT